jgi:hypothetical protein
MFDLKKLKELCPLRTWVEEQVYTILINKGAETKFAIRLKPKDARIDSIFSLSDFQNHYIRYNPHDIDYKDEYFTVKQVVEKSIHELMLYKERVYQLVYGIEGGIDMGRDVSSLLDDLSLHLSERKLSPEYAQRWAEYLAYIDVNYNPSKKLENDEDSRWRD